MHHWEWLQWLDGCHIFCLLIRQAVFFIHRSEDHYLVCFSIPKFIETCFMVQNMVLVNVPYAFEKNMYSAVVGRSIL